MRKILVFGGAFNPPTLAHEAIIAACLGLPRFKEVWVMPSGERTDKQMEASDEQRVKMLQLVRRQQFLSEPRLVISSFELGLPRPTTTYQTVQALAAAYPKHEFWFAFGSDSYQSMPSWPHGVELGNSLSKLVLFARGSGDLIMGNDIINESLPGALEHVSSTKVRDLAAEGHDIAQLVSEPVLRYIRRHKLY